MKSNNERAAPMAPQSRSRATAGTESQPKVLFAGTRAYGIRDGFLFSASPRVHISLEMSPERVRANRQAALKP